MASKLFFDVINIEIGVGVHDSWWIESMKQAVSFISHHKYEKKSKRYTATYPWALTCWLFLVSFLFLLPKNYTTLFKQHFCSIQTKNWIGFKSTCRNENTAWKNSLHNKCKNSIRVLNSNFKFLPSSKKIYIFNAQNYIQPVTFLLPQWIENFFV